MYPNIYLKQFMKPTLKKGRTKEIHKFNPAQHPERAEVAEAKIFVFCYNASDINSAEIKSVEETYIYKDSDKINWINIDGISKDTVETVCTNFNIHPLIAEDILSIGQRPKMDDIDGVLFCLLNMLYFNDEHCSVEQEQISIVLGKNFLITFQEDANRDVFNDIRDKLRLANSKIRTRGADYLFYSLLDIIVDHYYLVMEKLGEKIELLESEISKTSDSRSIAKINSMRKELLILKRNVSPVRDLVTGLIRSESDLLDEKINKYFKDVYDHIVQANEVADNYREIMASIQDHYINEVNLKMNEAMKVMAIVTCLFAPATVIGGIYGMNFEHIPFAHTRYGFYLTVAVMLAIPVYMLSVFKKRGWF